MNIIRDEKVDIIILDLKLPDMSGMDILNFISKYNISRYNSSIIIFTGEMGLLKEIIGNKYIFNYISKTNSLDVIIKQLKELICVKEKENSKDLIQEQIKTELELLHFNFSYIGTQYLYECVYQCYLKKNLYNINLYKEIYPTISKKYHKTISSIKANIFLTISRMYCEIDEKELYDYFGYNIIEKPKTKELVINILQKMKENLQ